MHVHPEIRGPLMTVGNYLGAANAYFIMCKNWYRTLGQCAMTTHTAA